MKTVQPMTGAHEVTMGANQPEYEPLIVAIHYDAELRSPVLVSRWKLSPEERERVAAGEDLYLGVVTFDAALQPVLLAVGPEGVTQGRDPIRPEEIRDGGA